MMTNLRWCISILTLITSSGLLAVTPEEVWASVSHHKVDNDGVSIHYATLGEGPTVIMIHGFPDFWYTWRHQMAGLSEHFRVVAVDQRGYNLSDAPAGVDSYAMNLLVSDVVAVVNQLGEETVTIVGHDWGGAVAWNFAFTRPELVKNLVVLNLPHPRGLRQAMATNAEARANTDYARKFREGRPEDPDIFFGYPMNSQTLSGWVKSESARVRYVKAFEQSDFNAMLNYYKKNYSGVWDQSDLPEFPRVAVPTLIFHGLEDSALHSDALNNTWDWIDADLTIVTAPGANHFVQQDAAELVTTTLRWWLLARR